MDLNPHQKESSQERYSQDQRYQRVHVTQGYQMSIYYPFHSRASNVTFFESKWDKRSPPGNPDVTWM